MPERQHEVTFEGARPGTVRCRVCHAELDLNQWAHFDPCPGPGEWVTTPAGLRVFVPTWRAT